jgi:hypothetical protein
LKIEIAGRRTTLIHEDNFFVNYDYDVTGNVIQVRENGATTGIGLLAIYTYDDLGRRTALTRGNGAVTGYGSYGDSCNNPQTSPDAAVPWGEGARSTRKRWERFRLDTQLLRFQSGAKLAGPD